MRKAANHDLPKVAEDFIKHGVYLRGWARKTVRTYRQGLNAFQMALGQPGDLHPSGATGTVSFVLTKAHLDTFVIWMRERGLSPGGCDMYIRTVNSYLSWLKEEGHLPQPLRIKLLPDPKKPLATFSSTDIRLIVSFRPKGRLQVRTWTLLLTLIDTGIRIEEALSLERAKVDLDNLTLRVLGKGSKERLVPISLELRKHLFRMTSKTDGRFVFATSSGTRLS